MSNEKLKPCLHCGCREAEAYHVPNLISMQCNECHAMGPPAKTLAEAIAAWNKRYVCLDKNGKPVYAGDEVKYTPLGQIKSREVSAICVVTELRPPRYGYGLVGDNDYETHTFYPSEIELVEVKK